MSEIKTAYHYRFAEFGPSEVARITGIPQVKQRDWRRRGIILSSGDGGHARFNTVHVAQLMVRQALADAGIELTESTEMAGVWAFVLIDYAAREPDSTGMIGEVSPEVLDQVKRQLGEPPPHRYLATFHPPVDPAQLEDGTAKDKLTAYIADYGRVIPTQTVEEAARWAALFQDVGFADAWTIVDLEALGKKLARLAERPIQHVIAGASNAPNPIVQRALKTDETPS